MDGAGYPDGLAAGRSPLAGRIVACCDALQAITSDRPYRRRAGIDDAIAELRAASGEQFDHGVVEALAEVVRRKQARELEPTPA